MYLLDTNVVCELRRPRPHGAVAAWLAAHADAALFISAVTIGELQASVEQLLDRGHPAAQAIETWLDAVAATFNVLPMDASSFRTFANLMHRQPDHLGMAGMIAATALSHGLVVVTREDVDFRLFGVATLDPFKFRRP